VSVAHVRFHALLMFRFQAGGEVRPGLCLCLCSRLRLQVQAQAPGSVWLAACSVPVAVQVLWQCCVHSQVPCASDPFLHACCASVP
jgi:hypothetical protein